MSNNVSLTIGSFGANSFVLFVFLFYAGISNVLDTALENVNYKYTMYP